MEWKIVQDIALIISLIANVLKIAHDIYNLIKHIQNKTNHPINRPQKTGSNMTDTDVSYSTAYTIMTALSIISIVLDIQFVSTRNLAFLIWGSSLTCTSIVIPLIVQYFKGNLRSKD